MDLRQKILVELDRQGNSTAEFIANQYLSALDPDLGNIRRALIELLNEGLIAESNVEETSQSVVRNKLDSTGPPPRKKADRLVSDKSIPKIRLYITLKGKLYLLEEKKLHDEMSLLRFSNATKIFIFVLAFLGFAAGVISLILDIVN